MDPRRGALSRRRRRNRPGEAPIWDQLDLATRVLDTMLYEARFPLTEPDAGPLVAGPGVYLIFFDGPLPLYRPVRGGRYPVYAGSAKSLRERIRRHRRNTVGVGSLHGGRDLWVLAVALADHRAAEYAEALTIDLLRPCWNAVLPGFGSRDQGRTRATQAPPPWSIVHPGRPVGRGRTKLSGAFLARVVERHLHTTARADLWPALGPRG